VDKALKEQLISKFEEGIKWWTHNLFLILLISAYYSSKAIWYCIFCGLRAARLLNPYIHQAHWQATSKTCPSLDRHFQRILQVALDQHSLLCIRLSGCNSLESSCNSTLLSRVKLNVLCFDSWSDWCPWSGTISFLLWPQKYSMHSNTNDTWRPHVLGPECSGYAMCMALGRRCISLAQKTHHFPSGSP